MFCRVLQVVVSVPTWFNCEILTRKPAPSPCKKRCYWNFLQMNQVLDHREYWTWGLTGTLWSICFYLRKWGTANWSTFQYGHIWSHITKHKDVGQSDFASGRRALRIGLEDGSGWQKVPGVLSWCRGWMSKCSSWVDKAGRKRWRVLCIWHPYS